MTNFQRTNAVSQSASAASSSSGSGADESLRLAQTIAQAMDDRKAANIVLLKVVDISYLTDYFVVATGFSSVQVRAIATSVEDKVQETLGRLPLRVEGQSDGSWVLMDYGDVIAHIFMPDEREYYGLEAFWGHAEQIPFSAAQTTRDFRN